MGTEEEGTVTTATHLVTGGTGTTLTLHPDLGSIIYHTHHRKLTKIYLHLIPTVVISGNSQRAVYFANFNSNSICFDFYQFNTN